MTSMLVIRTVPGAVNAGEPCVTDPVIKANPTRAPEIRSSFLIGIPLCTTVGHYLLVAHRLPVSARKLDEERRPFALGAREPDAAAVRLDDIS